MCRTQIQGTPPAAERRYAGPETFRELTTPLDSFTQRL
jgi:hypothetical protein